MNTYTISVSNGILTKEHRDRIGTAIWEFMWLIDKTTKQFKEGSIDVGVIHGGKPIKLNEISDQLGTTEMTVSRNLHKLEKAGYISILRTPYGLVLKVMKSKKRFNKNVVSPKNNVVSQTNENVESPNVFVGSPNENVGSNYDNTVDSTNDTTTVASDKEFSFQEELIKLKDHSRKDFKIIALYWKKKNWAFENREQYNAALKRELRAAKDLKGYSGEQIAKSISFCMKEYPDKWTLETVFKRIQDLVNKSP